MADSYWLASIDDFNILLAIAFSRLSFSDACFTFDVLVVGWNRGSHTLTTQFDERLVVDDQYRR
jgi:hypothetical protein